MPLYLGNEQIRKMTVSYDTGSSSGIDTSDATLTSGKQMLQGVTAYSKGTKITGSIPSVAAKTVTPSTSSQTAISAGSYASGDITVGPIQTETKSVTANGTYSPTSGKYFSSITVNVPSSGVDTTDATATASDIVSGKTAYVNGTRVSGSLVIQAYYTGTAEPASSLGNNGDLYLMA